MTVRAPRLVFLAGALAAVGIAGAFALGARGAAGPGVDTSPVRIAAPLGLGPVQVPADNPVTRAKIDLGRKLFMDRRLSPDNTMSCAMCHVPEQAFVANELGGAVGFAGRSHRRNAPTILNAAYFRHLFHDGREISLENQVWGPLLTFNEMANPAPGVVIEKIASLPDYADRFEAAFAGRGPSMQTIGQALAAYERTLVSGDSRFDRWYYGHERDALTAAEQRGFALFTRKGGCSACHTIGAKAALFSDDDYHNTGIGYARSMGQQAPAATHAVEVAPGVTVAVAAATIASFAEPRQGDVGRYEITLDPADRWKYRTPTLRNVALTGPYMHDGSLESLRQVVDFYDAGGIDNPDKDPRVRPLGLSAGEKADLIAFLKSLTGDNVEALARDARSAR